MHTARKGDTASGIAKRQGVSLADLAKMNPEIKDLSKIGVGQKIRYKADEPKADSTPKKSEAPAADPKPASVAPKKPEMVVQPDSRNKMSTADQQDADVKKVNAATSAAAASEIRKADPVVQGMKKDMPDAYDAMTKPKKGANILAGSRYDDGKDGGVKEEKREYNKIDPRSTLEKKLIHGTSKKKIEEATYQGRKVPLNKPMKGIVTGKQIGRAHV